MPYICRSIIVVLLFCLTAPSVARGADTEYHHVHLMASDATEAAAWYIEHMGCQAYEREAACRYGHVQVLFIEREPEGGSVGTAVDHIGFSFRDLDAKMVEWKAAGLTVLEDVREIDGLFKLAFIEDPWGTKIEVAQDHEDLGLHHLHLRSPNPTATQAWYQNVFGGQQDRMKGRIDGLRWGRVWLIVSSDTDTDFVPTDTRSFHHLGWGVEDMAAFVAETKAKGIEFSAEPRQITNSAGQDLIIAFIVGPDGALIEIVETL